MSSDFSRVFSSSVGTKLLIGLTGLLLFVYLVLHLAGNALIFAGPDTFNEYSHTLISNPLIVPIEIGLLAGLPAPHLQDGHDVAGEPGGAAGAAMQKKALRRPHQPQEPRLVHDDRVGPDPAAVRPRPRQAVQVRHLLPDASAATPIRDLYRTEIEVFRNPLWVAFYVIGTLLVGLHLRHGIASGFQSLGLDHPLYTRRLTIVGHRPGGRHRRRARRHPVWVYLTH